MKKEIGIFITSLILSASMAFAASTEFAMPKPGLTPNSSLYFFDELFEGIQEFFTFGAENKAKLQLGFAAERIAEIKQMVDEKGIEDKGVVQAEERLKLHMEKASGIIENESSKGKDMIPLADVLSEENELLEEAVGEIFENQIDMNERKIEELEAKLNNVPVGDKMADDLENEIEKLEGKIFEIGTKQEFEKSLLADGEIVFYKTIDDKRKSSKRIRASESEKRKLERIEKTKRMDSPEGDFAEAERLLSQSKTELENGNFSESARLAMLAKINFATITEILNDSVTRAVNISKGREEEQEKRDKGNAQRLINQAEREKVGSERAISKRGVNAPADIKTKAEDSLSRSKSEFERGNFREAERLARGAKEIFFIIRANAKDISKIRDDFEIEIEREKREGEIRIKFEDKIRARVEDEIHRLKLRQIKVRAEIINGRVLAKVETKFNTSKNNRTDIAQEILNRMSLSKEDIDKLLKIQNRRENEEFDERLEAKARVRKSGTTEAEAKFRFPLSNTERSQIVDGIFQKLQSLNASRIANAMEFRNDITGERIKGQEDRIRQNNDARREDEARGR